MKKIISIALAILISLETICVMVLAFICAPTPVNAYGYYNDTYDLARFNGLKGALFNWYTWLLEPSTTSIDEDLVSLSLIIIFMGMVLGCIMLVKTLFTKIVPNYLLLVAGIIAVYLAAYCLIIQVV